MNYRDFVQTMLKRAKINQEYRDIFTDPKGMEIFLAAVTHPTHDAEDNYQKLEFIGDGIIKGILSQYIPRRFPKMAAGQSVYSKKGGTSEGMLSKTRRFLEQRKTLSDFALALGFWDYVRADEETMAKLRKETLEDVFEAFIGALVEVVDGRVKRGLGYYYAYNFVEASLNDIEIEISEQTLDDPITRLNELYKAGNMEGGKQPLKWGDAVYNMTKIYLPRLEKLPPVSGHKDGELVFSLADKTAFVATPNGWVHVSRAPLIGFHVAPGVSEEDAQMMWYAGVYGFFNASTDITVNNQNKNDILKNPEQYGADIIGQGMHFKSKDAKKFAASQALHYLKKLGYKKIPTVKDQENK